MFVKSLYTKVNNVFRVSVFRGLNKGILLVEPPARVPCLPLILIIATDRLFHKRHSVPGSALRKAVLDHWFACYCHSL